MKPGTAAEIARRLWEMGCYEVSMGDTIGVGTPASVSTMFKVCPSTTEAHCMLQQAMSCTTALSEAKQASLSELFINKICSFFALF